MEENAITLKLDPKEILRYLNDLGIYNISGQVLKEFISDLKKIIKYDLYQHKKTDNKYWSERLHSTSTFSSRSRSRTSQDEPNTCKHCFKESSISNIMRRTVSAPIITHKLENNKFKRLCSCTSVDTVKLDSVKLKPIASASSNLIKVPLKVQQKRCDPVTLYHYYMSMWDKYKPPGENNWQELRWAVRQKLAGDVGQHNRNYKIVRFTNEELEKRREGWLVK